MLKTVEELQRDICTLLKNFDLYVEAPKRFPASLGPDFLELNTVMRAAPKNKGDQHLALLATYPWILRGSIIIMPEKGFGGRIEEFLTYHEISHTSPGPILSHLVEYLVGWVLLTRYAAVLLFVGFGWGVVPLTILLVAELFILSISDCHEVDSDFQAIRMLLSEKGEEHTLVTLRFVQHSIRTEIDRLDPDSLVVINYNMRLGCLEHCTSAIRGGRSSRVINSPLSPVLMIKGIAAATACFGSISIVAIFGQYPSIISFGGIFLLTGIWACRLARMKSNLRRLLPPMQFQLANALANPRSDPDASTNLIKLFDPTLATSHFGVVGFFRLNFRKMLTPAT